MRAAHRTGGALREIEVSVATAPRPRRGVSALDRWIAAESPAGATMLNIGAGYNLSGQLPRTRRRAAHLVGVDPSERVHANESLDEAHQSRLQTFAVHNEARFDVGFSVFVLEHVTDPRGFTRACGAVLKPGGLLFGLTVHKWHYFGLTTWALTRVGLTEWLLPKVRTPTVVERYHFPTAYRMNSVRALAGLLAEAGFRAVEFRMWDQPRMYAWYLPRPLAPVTEWWSRCAYRLDAPRMMGHLTFKATR